MGFHPVYFFNKYLFLSFSPSLSLSLFLSFSLAISSLFFLFLLLIRMFLASLISFVIYFLLFSFFLPECVFPHFWIGSHSHTRFIFLLASQRLSYLLQENQYKLNWFFFIAVLPFISFILFVLLGLFTILFALCDFSLTQSFILRVSVIYIRASEIKWHWVGVSGRNVWCQSFWPTDY